MLHIQKKLPEKIFMTSTLDKKISYKFNFSLNKYQKSESRGKFRTNQPVQYVYPDIAASAGKNRRFQLAVQLRREYLSAPADRANGFVDPNCGTVKGNRLHKIKKPPCFKQDGFQTKRERTLIYSSAVVSSNPQITLKFCTAAPAAPLIRLSIAEIVITREPTTRTVRWQRFV